MFVLDTNVAIHIRDSNSDILDKSAALRGPLRLSILTRIELEGGVYRVGANAALLRARLDKLLRALPTLAFDDAAAEAYGDIIAKTGYSRRKVIDRMIAAQALVRNATLVTLNAGDFADIPKLKLLAW